MAVWTVVLDANIYVSALAFGGKPTRALQLGITRRVDVAISGPIPPWGMSASELHRWRGRRVLVADTIQ